MLSRDITACIPPRYEFQVLRYLKTVNRKQRRESSKTMFTRV